MLVDDVESDQSHGMFWLSLPRVRCRASIAFFLLVSFKTARAVLNSAQRGWRVEHPAGLFGL